VKRGALALLLVAWAVRGHEPITTKLTWTREISRIVYQRCAACHREGGLAPMSLLSYEEARPWAKAIRDEVLERKMPPWGPVKGFGIFREDASLSEVEIDWLVNWVEGGAPKGEEIYLPPLPGPRPAPADPPAAKGLPVAGERVIDRAMTVVGIEPAGPVRLTAMRPDGSIEPLLWLRDRRPHQPKVYYFRNPIRLSRGARLRAEGSAVVIR